MAPLGRSERTYKPFSSRSCRRRDSLSAAYTPSMISPFGDASRQRNSTAQASSRKASGPPQEIVGTDINGLEIIPSLRGLLWILGPARGWESLERLRGISPGVNRPRSGRHPDQFE